MNRTLSVTLALICTSLAVMGCETTNRDYRGTGRVVDITSQPQRTAPVQSRAEVYSAGSTVTASSHNEVYTAPAVTYEPQVTSVSEPSRVQVYNPAAESTTVSTTTPVTYVPEATTTSSSSQAGVVKPYTAHNSADTYRVVKGDTLYSIAFRYGLDYRTLAKDNGIEPPYNIAVGQVIQLNMQKSAAPTYTVQKGDTLYSIAKKNGQSVDFLAGVNDLKAPYNLRVGQVLNLARTEPKGVAAASSTNAVIAVAGQSQTVTDNRARENTQAAAQTTVAASSKTANTSAQAEPVVVKGKTRTVSGVTWMWPTTGKIIEAFSLAEQGNKGIDISGSQGQRILAAADGQVVYAGNALRGYGNLIIINHANEFLSAYAHNDALLVSEGQKVVRGQQIARMGSTDAKSVRLHFEIRYRGQSVNPVGYLPK